MLALLDQLDEELAILKSLQYVRCEACANDDCIHRQARLAQIQKVQGVREKIGVDLKKL